MDLFEFHLLKLLGLQVRRVGYSVGLETSGLSLVVFLVPFVDWD